MTVSVILSRLVRACFIIGDTLLGKLSPSDDDCKRHVGFPRDCGPREPVIRMWNCIEGSTASDCQKNTRFYVRTCASALPLSIATNESWAFVWLVMIGGGVYLAAGMVASNRRTGATGLDALPHRRFWVQLYGLVVDGLQYTRSRGGTRRRHTKPEPGRRGSLLAQAAPLLTLTTTAEETPRSERKSSRRSNSKSKKEPKKNGTGGRKSGSKLKEDSGQGAAPLRAKTTVEEKEQMLQEQRSAGVHSSQQKIKVMTI
eukprot:SAG31_NODE_6253_length_2102_cov_1.213180_2_plen_257_part_00